MSNSTASPEWRQFEQLVSRIEQVLKPRNALVKSPDQIVDLVTGELREVDASIRYDDTDSMPALITVECRDRSPTQDVTWIEQLVSKRRDLGAAQTIAVTSSRFSEPAIAKARHYGIELRTVSDITDSDIASWMAPGIMVFDALKWSVVTLMLTFSADKGVQTEVSCGGEGTDEVILTRKSDKRPVALHELIEGLLCTKMQSLDGEASVAIGETIKLGEPQKRLTVNLIFGDAMFSYARGKLRGDLVKIHLIVDVQRVHEQVPFTKAFQYSDPEKVIFQASEATYSLGGKRHVIAQFEPDLSAGKDPKDRNPE